MLNSPCQSALTGATSNKYNSQAEREKNVEEILITYTGKHLDSRVERGIEN
jgi:hypothetical protein